MIDHDTRNCDDTRLGELAALAAAASPAGIAALDAAMQDFPGDARLPFLQGSLLIGERRFTAAHAALSRAVALDPEFQLARFQLGFFELTSGEPDAAKATWQLLHNLPDDHCLKLFVSGLELLVDDQFAACCAALRSGIVQNPDNPALNHDMQLIIDACMPLIDPANSQRLDEPDAVSATSLLLGTARRLDR